MTPLDQAGVVAAVNAALAQFLLTPFASPDALAVALGEAVGALAVVAAPEVDEGVILARAHAEAMRVIETT